MSNRQRLPNRRLCISFDLEHDGQRYAAAVGFYPGGQLGEIFIHGRKAGSTAELHAQDAAVLTSILLQHGVSPQSIAYSIAGPISAALRVITEAE